MVHAHSHEPSGTKRLADMAQKHVHVPREAGSVARFQYHRPSLAKPGLGTMYQAHGLYVLLLSWATDCYPEYHGNPSCRGTNRRLTTGCSRHCRASRRWRPAGTGQRCHSAAPGDRYAVARRARRWESSPGWRGHRTTEELAATTRGLYLGTWSAPSQWCNRPGDTAGRFLSCPMGRAPAHRTKATRWSPP